MHSHAFIHAGAHTLALHACTDQVRAFLLLISVLNLYTHSTTHTIQWSGSVQHDHMTHYGHIFCIAVIAPKCCVGILTCINRLVIFSLGLPPVGLYDISVFVYMQ